MEDARDLEMNEPEMVDKDEEDAMCSSSNMVSTFTVLSIIWYGGIFVGIPYLYAKNVAFISACLVSRVRNQMPRS